MQGKGEPTFEFAVECLDRLVSKLKPETSSKMRSAVVALYSSDYDERLRYSTQICLLHLDYDRHLKAHFLRFYHIEHLSLLLEVELYYGFLDSYRQKDHKLNLWGFDLWRFGTICIQFRNELDAQLFRVKVEQYAPKRQALLEISRREVEEELRRRKENSFFGKIKNIFKKSETRKEESVVIQVVKSNSVAIDKHGNFQTQTISPEWEEILRRSGLKPADMQDKQIAHLVLEEAIIFETKKAAEADPNFLVSAGLTRIEDLQDEQQEKEKPRKEEDQVTCEKVNQLVKVKNNCQKQEQREWKNTESTIADTLSLPPPPPHAGQEVPLLPAPLLDLPPPPPPPPLPLPPANRASLARQNLLEQIRSNRIKLKPVKANGETFQIDASAMNKEERIDLSQQIRKRLQARKAALNRHRGDEED